MLSLLSFFIFIFAVLLGFSLFLGVLKLIPTFEERDLDKQKNEILKEAIRQKEIVTRNLLDQADQRLQILKEELAEEAVEKKENFDLEDKELDSRFEFMETENTRITKDENSLEEKWRQLEKITSAIGEKKNHLEEQKAQIISNLEQKTKISAKDLTGQLVSTAVEERQIDNQKFIKLIIEDLDSNAKKLAHQTLDISLSRYAPNFVWPKHNNFVEISNKQIFEHIEANESVILEGLKEQSGVQIQALLDEKSGLGSVKFAGGFGISREAARLALQSCVELNQINEKSLKNSFDKFYTDLSNQAVILGKEAVDILKLSDIHPQIQKLIGALNWRTSYRQNQWYHTVEVATLAGVLAQEIGEDPDAAKRVGLLHDIGKALDYKIEGSHAVISGDYADRYGESRLICDTVMSHHSDLIIETPLAYILRSADTLSGARPGARVNLEEGYQIRLSAINDVIDAFEGIQDSAIMNGGREIHIRVDHDKISEKRVSFLGKDIAAKIQQEVAYPGQIKIVISRTFRSTSVA